MTAPHKPIGIKSVLAAALMLARRKPATAQASATTHLPVPVKPITDMGRPD